MATLNHVYTGVVCTWWSRAHGGRVHVSVVGACVSKGSCLRGGTSARGSCVGGGRV